MTPLLVEPIKMFSKDGRIIEAEVISGDIEAQRRCRNCQRHLATGGKKDKEKLSVFNIFLSSLLSMSLRKSVGKGI